ncbi:MAG TPA: tetratricopeptide repeat protein [Tepidisphaeraceae bacterium]|jgi:predicted O-linked N-acetylglucosamine transferase (SPINDLY family)
MAWEPVEQLLRQAVQFHQAGQLDAAEGLYRQIIKQTPFDGKVLHLFGMLLFQKGQRKEGLDLLRRAIEIDPTIALYHVNFGSALAQEGHIQEALVETRKALALTPGDAQTHFNLGRLLEACEQLNEAAEHYRQAIAIRGDFAAAHNNLGNVLFALGRAQEAETSYRASLQSRPLDPKSHKNLARTLHDLGRLAEAAEQYQTAMGLDPSDAEIQNNLGTVLASSRRYDDAIGAYQRALSIRPDDTMAMTNLGNSLKEIGRPAEGIALFRRALELGADVRTGNCLNLAIHLHPDYDPKSIYDVHRSWEERFARPLAPLSDFFPNDPNPSRRLRIGYVSPQFGDQIVGHCIIQLLSNHDHGAFEIVCYSDTRKLDWMTDRIRPAADVWRNVVGLSDDQLTSLIRQDQIDILVDLNMHMERNRLLVFARKPAPIQITWIGYPSTTGLRTIDYRLSDPYLDPPAEDGGPGDDEQFYSERTIRLPDSYWCYQPLENLPAANELPALRNGYFTFGCLNSFIKVSDATVRLWAAVLRSVENSKLLILAPAGSARDRLLALFKAEQIDSSRIGFLDRCGRRQYMELYHQVDLGLDTAPYTGHTTTLDSLWMGVPVMSLTGGTAVSRGGLSILSNVGLAEYCTHRDGDFVAKATAVAADLNPLAELRKTLRERMRSSPLMDGRTFAGNVESAYRQTWQRWCETQSLAPAAAGLSRSFVSAKSRPDRYHIVTLEPVNHPESAAFDDLSRLLQLSLESLGIPVTSERNVFRSDAVNILLGYHLLKDPVNAFWIPFQLEQLNVEGRRTSAWLEILSRAPEIWDYDPGNIAYLESRGIRTAKHVPLGFHPKLGTIPQRPADIDVLHYGIMSERRERILNDLSRRCRLHVATKLFGAQRDELIARSKIVLNIHRFEAPIFEQVRVSYLLNNGRCVVTEDSPYNPYRGMAITSNFDHVVDRCLSLLLNDAERQSLAEYGARQFASMPMTAMLSSLLKESR